MRAPLLSECFALLAGLYGALTDDKAFVERRADCEAWLFRHRGTDEAMATFLCHQLRRAVEARQVSRDISNGRSGGCAAVVLGTQGRVVAASPDAWTLLRRGHPARVALSMPAALVAQLAPALATGAIFPRALRVARDDGSGEIAGVLLGVDEMPVSRGKPRRITTVLLWDPGAEAKASAAATR